MKKTKTYIAKQALPGGIAKGDKIREEGGFYFLEKNDRKLPYDCELETQFFTVEKEPAFAYGERVCLKAPRRCKIVNANGYTKIKRDNTVDVQAHTELEVLRPDGKGFVVKVLATGCDVLATEAELKRASYIMFYNSKGVLCRELVGRNPGAERFGRQTGNLFDNEEDAKKWLAGTKNWKLEFDRCRESPYYFATNYMMVDGKPYTTNYTEEEFNKKFKTTFVK